MKMIEVKKIGVISSFKVTLYMMAIPAIISFIIGLIMVLVGMGLKQWETVGLGFVIGLGYPIMFLVIYGPLSMLFALIYNLFARKFGGLEWTIEEKWDDTIN